MTNRVFSRFKEVEIFCDIAHGSIGHKRKYTQEPYSVHPRNVAYLVRIFGGTDNMIKAAYLHDVVEDVFPKNSLFSLDYIAREFNEEVANLVDELTDKTTHEDGNRDKRKEIDRERIELISPQAKTIKLADLIDNSLTIFEYDPGFARVYLKEKKLLLEVLKNSSSPELYCLAHSLVVKQEEEDKRGI